MEEKKFIIHEIACYFGEIMLTCTIYKTWMKRKSKKIIFMMSAFWKKLLRSNFLISTYSFFCKEYYIEHFKVDILL